MSQRAHVAARVCKDADNVRESITSVIDAVWENPTLVGEKVQAASDSLADLDASVRDWEQIKDVVEDTCEALRWRETASEVSSNI
jgi:hypothetical protein